MTAACATTALLVVSGVVTTGSAVATSPGWADAQATAPFDQPTPGSLAGSAAALLTRSVPNVDDVLRPPAPPLGPVPTTRATGLGARGDRRSARIRWASCGDDSGQQCANFVVPRSWSKPQGKTITLALRRIPADRAPNSAPSVFVNPGGPGGSGTGFIRDAGQSYEPLTGRYNVVGWDPRGVPNSGPRLTSCPIDQGLMLQQPATGAIDWLSASSSRLNYTNRQLGQCLKANQQTKTLVSTTNDVRDLDAMRKGVGDKKLTYLGYSYGTTIGQVYSSMFPRTLGRMILDGVTDPTFSQAGGMSSRRQGSATGWKMQRDVFSPAFWGVYDQLDAYLENQVIPSEGVDFTRWLLWGSAINSLRSPTDAALFVFTTCAAASLVGITDPVCTLPTTASAQKDVASYVRTVKSSPVLQLVNCGDLSDRPTAKQLAKQTRIAASSGRPEVAVNVMNFAANCGNKTQPWSPLAPMKSRTLPTAPLIINGIGDVATPYPYATRTRSQINGSRLITATTTYHGLFLLNGGTCINNLGLKYLLDGKLPNKDKTCPVPVLFPPNG